MKEQIQEHLLGTGGFIASIYSTVFANLTINSMLAALVSISWLIYIWKKILKRRKTRVKDEDTDI